jgi:hypothetical protein
MSPSFAFDLILGRKDVEEPGWKSGPKWQAAWRCIASSGDASSSQILESAVGSAFGGPMIVAGLDCRQFAQHADEPPSTTLSGVLPRCFLMGRAARGIRTPDPIITL